MTFQQFIEKYNGKYIDFDGVYGAQCMDLMHQYCVEVLGISDGSVLASPCAKDVYNNFPTVSGHALFEQIGNTPTAVPQQGDIVFWGNGTWGHVAIFISGDANSFVSYDQNYPTGSPCHAQNHTYTGVLGWLRYKGQPADNYQVIIDQLRADRDKNWNLYQQQLQHSIAQEDIIAEKQKTIDAITKENLNLKEQVTEAQQTHSTDLEAIQDLKRANEEKDKEIAVKDEELIKATKDLQVCQTSKDNLSYASGVQLFNELLKRIVGR